MRKGKIAFEMEQKQQILVRMLRFRRESLGISREAIAKELGISVSMMQAWENGATPSQFWYGIQWMRLLGIDYDLVANHKKAIVPIPAVKEIRMHKGRLHVEYFIGKQENDSLFLNTKVKLRENMLFSFMDLLQINYVNGQIGYRLDPHQDIDRQLFRLFAILKTQTDNQNSIKLETMGIDLRNRKYATNVVLESDDETFFRYTVSYPGEKVKNKEYCYKPLFVFLDSVCKKYDNDDKIPEMMFSYVSAKPNIAPVHYLVEKA